jgi:uncharacterized protein
MIIFFATVIAITLLLHGFLYHRLAVALDITTPAALWLLRLAALFLALSYILARAWERLAPHWVVQGMYWFSSVWLGLMWELLWITLVFYLVKLGLMAGGVWGRLEPQTITQLGRFAAIAVSSLAVLLCGYGMVSAMGRARIANLQVPVKQITPELRELKIAMASDWHVGVLIGKPRLEKMTGQIMALKPDIILLPGDIVDQNPADLQPLLPVLKKLQAPLGVFGTTGNHEYYIGVQRAVEYMRAAGVQMLMNESVELPNGLQITGIEDRTAAQMHKQRPTVTQLLANAKEKPTIFLNHSPFVAEARAAAAAGADLTLSGHTHAGQIWPFTYLSRMAFPYNFGLYRLGEHYQYTSCGYGYWGPPMRIFAPPEIVVIRLVGSTEPARVEWTCCADNHQGNL